MLRCPGLELVDPALQPQARSGLSAQHRLVGPACLQLIEKKVFRELLPSIHTAGLASELMTPFGVQTDKPGGGPGLVSSDALAVPAWQVRSVHEGGNPWWRRARCLPVSSAAAVGNLLTRLSIRLLGRHRRVLGGAVEGDAEDFPRRVEDLPDEATSRSSERTVSMPVRWCDTFVVEAQS